MQIVEKPAMFVIGIPVKAQWDDLWIDMPAAWRSLWERRDLIRHRVGDRAMDVSLEKRDGVYHQLAGVEVSRIDSVPQGMLGVEIPAQRYIHLRHEGPLPDIALSFGMIYKWAKENGHATDAFKLDIGYRPGGDDPEHDLFVRLAPGTPWRTVRPRR